MSKQDHSKSTEATEASELSKTQLKKQAHSLQDLAREITQLPPKTRNSLDLSAEFIQAIEESKRITSHIAIKRHFQYMGKLLAKSDYQSIQQQLHQSEAKNANFQVRDQIISQWMEAFIEDEAKLNDYLYQHYNQESLQELRALVRNYRKKPEPPHSKKLFKALRQLDNQQQLPPVGQLGVVLG